VIEDACRGIDIDGSMQETRDRFARAGIETVDSTAVLSS